ncbi:CoA transferase [Kitasatospora sp. LaBMicrA B282]|uniref:CoA transferase n=1 Tax=Kitasatospora sp. LaBMicrA B282 TaxID=3420949 RepID=UPI003D0D33EA
MSSDAASDIGRAAAGPPLAGSPLAGRSLTVAGDSTAAALAARHLGALGCRVTREPGAGVPAGVAGRLELDGVGCTVDWAGPVRLPLASETDVQAACGIAQVHGRRYGEPTPLGVDYAGAVAGVLAVQGLLAARLAALRGAPVREVRTSVAGAALLAVGQYLAAATAGDDESAEGAEVAEAFTEVDLAPCEVPPFTSRDGVRFEIEALEAGRWLVFWERLGAERRAIGRGWPPFQLRFSSGVCPLPGELAGLVRGFAYHEVVAAATAAGVGIVPVRLTGVGEGGEPPWRIGGGGARWAGEPLGELGGGRLPLGGLLVVEMTRRLQGPLAGHLLALLGARVIRIEPEGGDPLRGVPPMAGDCSARFHALNRGKEAVQADPRSAAGQRAIRELVDQADVFLHNLAPGKAEAFGLGADELLADRPGLVHAWASGWGELFGPDAPVGTDYLVQAHSGLAALVTPPGRPPTPSLMTITDIFGGLVSAEGVLAALVARAATGCGRRVDSSLWSAARVLLGCASAPGVRGAPGGAAASLTPGEIARDPRFAGALHRDRCLLPNSPWEFVR